MNQRGVSVRRTPKLYTKILSAASRDLVFVNFHNVWYCQIWKLWVGDWCICLGRQVRQIRNLRETSASTVHSVVNQRVSCFLFLVSCFLFLVSCFLLLVSCFLFLVSCFLFLVACFLFLVSCFLFLVSCFLPARPQPQYIGAKAGFLYLVSY